jgi:hypothetical protein
MSKRKQDPNTVLTNCDTDSLCRIYCDRELDNGQSVSEFIVPGDKRLAPNIQSKAKICRIDKIKNWSIGFDTPDSLQFLETKTDLTYTKCEDDNNAIQSAFGIHGKVEHYRNQIARVVHMDELHFVKQLGSGLEAEVLLCCGVQEQKNVEYVAKIFHHNQEFTNDVFKSYKIQEAFAIAGLAIAPIALIYPDVIIMRKIDGTLHDLLNNVLLTDSQITMLVGAILRLLLIMCEHDFTHGDFHVGNIAFYEHRLVLIDFGYSHRKACDPDREITTLIGSLRFVYNISNRSRMKKLLGEFNHYANTMSAK